MANGSASSVTDASPEASRASIARRAGWASAANVASRRSVASRPYPSECITQWLYTRRRGGRQAARWVARIVLEAAGYEVIEAADGLEVIKALREAVRATGAADGDSRVVGRARAVVKGPRVAKPP